MSDGREGSRFFYHRVAKVNRREHAVERYVKLAELAGGQIGNALRCQIPSGDPPPALRSLSAVYSAAPLRTRRRQIAL